MSNILHPRQARTLKRFADSHVVVAFDYDGTLAPIVPTPGLARMRPKTRRLLRAVARRYPCVAITGRRRADLRRRLRDIPVREVFGNHGVEPCDAAGAYGARVREWVRQLRRQLARHQGIRIEDKVYSVSVHYRQARQPRRALAAIRAAVRDLHGARLLAGKRVVNLIPRGAPDKGGALERAMGALGCDRVIYLGDDETDEDAFGALGPRRMLAIRVGTKRASRARYWLRSQLEIDAFLEALAALRPARQPPLTKRTPQPPLAP
jgi:trehalose 6-phosphate phosphatase